jgi:hypothetical protein
MENAQPADSDIVKSSKPKIGIALSKEPWWSMRSPHERRYEASQEGCAPHRELPGTENKTPAGRENLSGSVSGKGRTFRAQSVRRAGLRLFWVRFLTVLHGCDEAVTQNAAVAIVHPLASAIIA